MSSTDARSSLPPAGWYPNPTTGETAYWDGAAWSDDPQSLVSSTAAGIETPATNESADQLRAGLTPSQEIIDVDVPAHKSNDLHAHIMQALSQKQAHRIVTMTMATYGEFPLFYRVLIVIEYL